MCNASAHEALAPSLFFQCPLRSCFNRAEIFSSSCNGFATHSTLRWSHDAKIHTIPHA